MPNQKYPEEFYLVVPESQASFTDHPGADIPRLMLPKESQIIISKNENNVDPHDFETMTGEQFLKSVNGIHNERFWYRRSCSKIGVSENI